MTVAAAYPVGDHDVAANAADNFDKSRYSAVYWWLDMPKCTIAAGYEDEEQDVNQAYDSLAANLGIDHFSVMLRRATKQEQDDLLGQAKRPK